MDEAIITFQKLFNKKEIKMECKPVNQIIQNFKFYMIMQDGNDHELSDIKEQVNRIKIIVINKIKEYKDKLLIIVFDHTIILISESKITFFFKLFNFMHDSIIFSLSNDVKSLLPTNLQNIFIKYEEDETMKHFSNHFVIKQPNFIEIKIFWSTILPSFSSYFINKCYLKLQNQRQKNEFTNINENEIKEGKYLKLQKINRGSVSTIELIYHIEYEEIFAAKIFDDFEQKAFQRENENYQNIQSIQMIPHFYCQAKMVKNSCLIIEYIMGKSLDKIKDIKLNESDKMSIILQLMLIVEFIQYRGYVHRDLRPNNIIINQNKKLILIDFDRMILHNEIINDDTSKNFYDLFICPEIRYDTIRKYSFKEDVYSIGLLIYFIIFEDIPSFGRKDKSNENNFLFNKFQNKYPLMEKICEECTETDPKNRPKITMLIDYFYNNFIIKNKQQQSVNLLNFINEEKINPKWIRIEEDFGSKNQLKIDNYFQKINKIHLFYQIKLGSSYYPQEYFIKNIDKFIYC